MKIFLIYSILKIELIYYRNPSEYANIIFNLILMYLMITASNTDDLFGLLIVFMILNYEVLYILLHFKLPMIDNTLGDISIDLKAENDRLTMSVLYKEHFLFLINAANIIPHLMLPLIKEYIENPDLDTYKLNFLKRNLLISFDQPTKEN